MAKSTFLSDEEKQARNMLGRWRNRILATEIVDPKTLLENPLNFRVHSQRQQEIMVGALDEIGWIEPIIVNKNTGNMINGHMRLGLAIKSKEQGVPVQYVDLTLEEERTALATFDPIGQMASTSASKITELLEHVSVNSVNVSQFLESIKPKDPTVVFQKGAEGMGPEERLDVYESNALRQVVLIMPITQYNRAVELLGIARASMDVESNADAVLALLERQYGGDQNSGFNEGYSPSD